MKCSGSFKSFELCAIRGGWQPVWPPLWLLCQSGRNLNARTIFWDFIQYLAKFWTYITQLGNFNCCKWPNNEKTIKPSDHTVHSSYLSIEGGAFSNIQWSLSNNNSNCLSLKEVDSFPRSLATNQCDQIGELWKVLGINLLTKVAKMIGDLLGYFEKDVGLLSSTTQKNGR